MFERGIKSDEIARNLIIRKPHQKICKITQSNSGRRSLFMLEIFTYFVYRRTIPVLRAGLWFKGQTLNIAVRLRIYCKLYKDCNLFDVSHNMLQVIVNKNIAIDQLEQEHISGSWRK